MAKSEAPINKFVISLNNKLVFHKSVNFRAHSCDRLRERLSDFREKMICKQSKLRVNF